MEHCLKYTPYLAKGTVCIYSIFLYAPVFSFTYYYTATKIFHCILMEFCVIKAHNCEMEQKQMRTVSKQLYYSSQR